MKRGTVSTDPKQSNTSLYREQIQFQWEKGDIWAFHGGTIRGLCHVQKAEHV